ncbi:MAG: hypothetical protein A2W72_01565 [Burkholderiales bacterium RIFCSPLOWO2_12_67_14]|nr:MAG: hypothetical protein A3I64_07240 [Burkholderiales bacterium RIFCSPLOWO2_02_FULL_67_64]OGB40031.1 MAG: hypothetical protein A3E51_05525 [Burkholderiales bacterium RIFCSPHIGHO2_12_FULL_67_38]OGB46821.1 MAG: hypothetical protein A2W72_01565 [Burkholderiales bacterium RIFCSPLOWO2_12_67_14]OGB75915.1 MAG: hypothetical protein A3G82_07285 [Burkholderiales bacterium RIFCSPLOWO2_12_FULL_67_210]
MSWLSLIPYLLAGAIAAGATWPLARAPLQGDIADLRMENAGLREDNAETLRKAAIASAARLQEATDRSQALGVQLLRQVATNATLAQEKTHAIKASTAGRACLSDRALRVLNTAPGLSVAAPGGLPAAGPGAAAEGGATATDTDIGTWAVAVGQQHETCRERLNALIDWHAQQPPAEPAD